MRRNFSNGRWRNLNAAGRWAGSFHRAAACRTGRLSVVQFGARKIKFMAKCVTCNKITGFGRNVPKSMHATRRTFKPNLQKTTIMKGGRRMQVTMCTKCMKALAKT